MAFAHIRREKWGIHKRVFIRYNGGGAAAHAAADISRCEVSHEL